MGRHSAPDDDEDSTQTAVLTELPADDVALEDGAAGRHARGDEEPVDVGLDITAGTVGDTAETPALFEEPATPPAPSTPPARTGHSTGADFALVRRHGDVRARCLAGLLAPFVLYAVAMIVGGASGRQVLLWLFIPLITAGVLVGIFLDAGHKRYPTG
jgi:hypothetical protein